MKNRIKYPPTLETELKTKFRYDYTVEKVFELFDYMFKQIYLKGERQVQIPKQTLIGILGQRYPNILKKLSEYIIRDDSYSTIKHECKKYSFTNKFITELSQFNTWSNLKEFITTLSESKGSSSQEQIITANKLNSTESLVSSIMCIGDGNDIKSMYTIDKDRFETIKDVFDRTNYKTDLQHQAVIQSTKRLIEDITNGDIRETVSDKNHRHFTQITQIMKEVRKCLIKNTEKFVGELDLKCCHGYIALNLFKDNISKEEYTRLFNNFKDANFWYELIEKSGGKINDKETVKAKFQLFMNGSLRHNGSNWIYQYFKTNYPEFTETLFQYKESTNISNEINRIEASIMHSEELRNYLQTNKLNVDIIHDCLWIYGKGDSDDLLNAAKYIIRMFEKEYGFDMVFTMELEGKPKEIIE